MKKFIQLLFLLCGIPLFSLATTSSAQTDGNTAHNVIVDIQPIINNWTGTGFLPVRVEIINNTPTRGEWFIHVAGDGNTENAGDRITTPKTIALNPGESINTTLYIPSMGDGGSLESSEYYYRRCLISVSGTGLKNPQTNIVSVSGSNRYNHLSSPDIDPKLNDGIYQSLQLSGYFKSTPYVLDKIENWPADERVFSPFYFAVFTKPYYDSLNQSYRQALRKWISKGGHLFILDPSVDAPSEKIKQGMGYIQTIGNYKAKKDKEISEIISKMPSIQGNEAYLLPVSWKNYISLPPTGLISIMLLTFAVLAGPLSLFVWAPAGKRQRLFFLVPGFAVGFSLLIILIIFISEGFGGKGRRETQIFLDPHNNIATVIQGQICRTAVMVVSRFPLEEATEFYAYKYNTNGEKDYDKWKNIMPNERVNGEAAGGWFPSRSTLFHKLKATIPTRARISIVGKKGDAPIIQSTIPCTLTNFIYISPDRIIWKADSVPQGNQVTLTKAEKKGDGNHPIDPGNFRAVGSSSILAPIPTHPGITWKNDNITYSGIVVDETTKQQDT